MTTLTTNYKYNFTKAENDLFSWNTSSADFLTYKSTGQQIYQMEWYEWKNSQPITDPAIITAVKEFQTELRNLQSQKPPRREEEYQEEPHGFGWCDKCGSYCYGDCTAN
jgi:hypothetical protein